MLSVSIKIAVLHFCLSLQNKTKNYGRLSFSYFSKDDLGPILFIIFIADFSFMNNDAEFANYADDTNPYVCRKNFSEVAEYKYKIHDGMFLTCHVHVLDWIYTI